MVRVSILAWHLLYTPFLGNRKIKSTLGADYLEWIKYCYAPAGAIELVGYFFRRIFSLIKSLGFQSLIATNTIAQGAAREGGLEVIEKSGGTINFAIKSIRWPGLAAVNVSLIAIFKGKWNKKFILENKNVEKISTYLDDSEGLGNPFELYQNTDKSFIGSYVLGKGFILQPEEAFKLIENSSKNRDVLYPYLNGEDLNGRHDQSPSRWIINFFDWPEDKCKEEYPDCYYIVEKLVKPERQRENDKGKYVLRKPLPQRWWQYADKRPKLYRIISEFEKILAVAQVSRTLAFTFVKNDKVLDAKLIVFAINEFWKFAILQSSFHSRWSWKYCTTMKTDLTYTPTKIFETYPFPQNMTKEMEEELEHIGEEYHEFRRELMLKIQLGLTKTYNLFHCQDLTIDQVKKESKKDQNTCETGFQDILKLRQLHQQMDEAVLRAYEWTDIELAHDFYEVDYLLENDRIRYTISPPAHKEILKRLLELNHKIHEQEVKAGLVETKPGKKDNSAKEPGEHGFGPGTLFTNRNGE